MGWNQTGRVRAGLAVATTAVVAALVLTGCTPEAEPAPDPVASASSTPVPTDAPDPVLDPAGDATANLAYFDFVNRALIATYPTPTGQQTVENLVAAGFVKADMELTPDATIGGEAAESIQYAVRINGTCLIGQTGGAGYNAIAAPLLGTGKCLIGKTRTIDF
jgi:hypothetical protein